MLRPASNSPRASPTASSDRSWGDPGKCAFLAISASTTGLDRHRQAQEFRAYGDAIGRRRRRVDDESDAVVHDDELDDRAARTGGLIGDREDGLAPNDAQRVRRRARARAGCKEDVTARR